MSDTLRDQLLGLGFKSAPAPERRPERKPDQRRDARSQAGKPAAQPAGKPHPGNRNRSADARKPHERARTPDSRQGQKPAHAQGKPRSREDIDLAKAYAIRAQREKDERLALERQKQEEARLRREARAKLEELIKDKGLNDPEAEIARHFPYGGKIKRIYVNAEQLKALNAGELGVLQQNGRYVLVTAALLDEAEAVFAPSVALRVDPNASAEEDPYADPQYQVPDDLVW